MYQPSEQDKEQLRLLEEALNSDYEQTSNNNYDAFEVLETIDYINKIFYETYQREASNYFGTGHCYYYAKMLKTLFPKGTEVLGADGHYVAKIDNVIYDVDKAPTIGNFKKENYQYVITDERGPFINDIPTSKEMQEEDEQIIDGLITAVENWREEKQEIRKIA